MNYGQKFRKTKNKLLKLDSLYKIGESHFVNKFLSRLDTRYEIFFAMFNQTHSLIEITAVNKIVVVAVVIFDKAIIAAKKKNSKWNTKKNPNLPTLGSEPRQI